MLSTDAVFNGLLVVSSGYAMYKLPAMDMPFGYAAAAVSLVHGLLGVVRAVTDDDDEPNQVRLITSSIMQIIPLPAVNIELYLRSPYPHLAILHTSFLIMLAKDMVDKLHDIEDNATELMKNVTLLANVVSMLFLSVNQSSKLCAAMAGMTFFGRYLPFMIDYYISDGLGHPFNLAAHSAYVVMMALMLSAKH